MDKYYYIYGGKVLIYAIQLEGSTEVSNDYDRQQSVHVSMTPEQIAFYEANKTASVKEVWECQLLLPVMPTLEERKAQLFQDFDPVINDFAILTTRCRSIYGTANADLEAVITLANYVRKRTIDTINGFTELEPAMAFQIREADIQPLKDRFKPFMF